MQVNNNNNNNESATKSLHHVLVAFPELPVDTFRQKLEQALSAVARASVAAASVVSSSASSCGSSGADDGMTHMDGSMLVMTLQSMDWTAICQSYDDDNGELQQQQQQQQLFCLQADDCTGITYSPTSTTIATTLLEQLLQVLNNPVIFPAACRIWLVQVLLEQIVWGFGYSTETERSHRHLRHHQHNHNPNNTTTTTTTTTTRTTTNKQQWPASQKLLLQHVTQWLQQPNDPLLPKVQLVPDIFSLVTAKRPFHRCQQHTATTLNNALSVWKHWMRTWQSLPVLLPLLWDLLYTIDNTEDYYQKLHSQQQQQQDVESYEEDSSHSRRPVRQHPVIGLARLHGEADDDDDDDSDYNDDESFNNNNNNRNRCYQQRLAASQMGVSRQQQHGRWRRHAATQLLALRNVRIKCLRTLQSVVEKNILVSTNDGSKTRRSAHAAQDDVDLYLYTMQQSVMRQPKQLQSIFVRLGILYLVQTSSSLSSSQQQQQQQQVQRFDNQQLLQVIWSRKTKASNLNNAGFWLGLFVELLVECAVFDQWEQLWNGVMPLLDWLQQALLLLDNDNKSIRLETRILCRLHLQALACLMAYRGNMLKQQLETQTILAQLSNQYDEPGDWLDASSLSPEEYLKLQSTLQEMGVFGFCHDSKGAKSSTGENNNGWFFDPSADQTIRACGSYYLSSLFPNNNASILSSLSPVNGLPQDEKSKDDGSAMQPQKQPPVPMLDYIHDDVLRHIFLFLGYKRIVRMRLVCQNWKEIADHDDGIWRPLYKSRFGYAPDDPALVPETNNMLPWQRLFRDRWIAERAIRFRRDKNGWKARLCCRIGCLAVLSTPGRLQRHTAWHAKYLANKKTKKRSKQTSVRTSGRPTKKIMTAANRQP